jgi:hypothetical protein
MSADPLFNVVAAGEPEDLRTSYLTVPEPGRPMNMGTTTPLIDRTMERRGDGLYLPPHSAGAQYPA